jgi:hypothetical protein
MYVRLLQAGWCIFLETERWLAQMPHRWNPVERRCLSHLGRTYIHTLVTVLGHTSLNHTCVQLRQQLTGERCVAEETGQEAAALLADLASAQSQLARMAADLQLKVRYMRAQLVASWRLREVDTGSDATGGDWRYCQSLHGSELVRFGSGRSPGCYLLVGSGAATDVWL